jgi:hypothetical protein
LARPAPSMSYAWEHESDCPRGLALLILETVLIVLAYQSLANCP